MTSEAPAAATEAKKGPPPEAPSAIRTRSLVVGAFWAVILFCGLPMWWSTTSIYRAQLPLQEMMDWAEGRACRPVFPLEILVDAPSIASPEAQHLVRTTQHALDDLNDFSAHHLRLRLSEPSGRPKELADEEWPEIEPGLLARESAALSVRLLPQENTTPRTKLHPYAAHLDIFYAPSQVPSISSSSSPLAHFIAGELQQIFTEEQAMISHVLSTGNAVGPGVQPSITPIQSSQASQGNREQRPAAMTTVNPQWAATIARRATRSFKYAETYHLTFSLFTPGAEPSSWDIEAAIQAYLAPLLDAFSPISNFSVDTQVQLYASFSPTAPLPEYDETQAAWTLKKEDLSAFINAAEWPLGPSIGSGPTINFVLYVPSPSQSPLVVAESGATSWLIPQWGGVVILNQPQAQSEVADSDRPHLSKESLHPALSTFYNQLSTLLGLPTTPASLPLRLQTLTRVRAASLLLSASSTMGSLARLTQSLASIPIPRFVATSVERTLSHLSTTCQSLRDGRFEEALTSARVAESEAERSFFEKSMVGQMYFPDEHKVAVYLPLLGPIAVPLILALVKQVKRIVGDRKNRKTT